MTAFRIKLVEAFSTIPAYDAGGRRDGPISRDSRTSLVRLMLQKVQVRNG
jgi:hypothetical protein